MPALLLLRPLTDEETTELRRLAQRQTVEARLRERARICWRSHEGQSVREIMAALHLDDRTVRRWIHRFNAQGLPGLTDAPRQGRPTTYTRQEVGTVVATSLTPPDDLGLPFGSWTLDRLVAYLHETHGITMQRSRIGEILQAEGVRWRTQETWFGERVDPAFAAKRGRSSPSTKPHPPTAS
jgi:transposase